jgi:hypothetical protein
MASDPSLSVRVHWLRLRIHPHYTADENGGRKSSSLRFASKYFPAKIEKVHFLDNKIEPFFWN